MTTWPSSPRVSPSLRLRAAAELERRRRAREAALAALRADPDALCAAADIAPDPWQRNVLTETAQAVLLNCGRQVGKSTITALVVARMLLGPATTTVIATPSERQSKELLRKVLVFWRRIGRPVAAVAANKTSLELANGSRLEAFPASSDTIRGISAVDLLVADEASVVPDALYYSLAPMLAVSGGRLFAPSTPKGKRGWWHGLWEARDDADVARFLVPSDRCPRIAPSFLARERRRIGAWWYDQEYGCVFQDAETAAFRSEDVDAAFRPDVAFDTELFAS